MKLGACDLELAQKRKRPRVEALPFGGEPDPPIAAGTVEQRAAEVALEGLEARGQRRLGDVQLPRRPDHAALY